MGKGQGVLPGRVQTLRNTCQPQPGLAASPHRARCDPDSWSSSPFLGTLFRRITQLGPNFCLDRLP